MRAGFVPITYDRIDAVTEPHGVHLSEEPRVWWRWCNGLSERLDPPDRHLGVSFIPLSIESAGRRYAAARRLATEMSQHESGHSGSPDWWWEGIWWPMFESHYGTDLVVVTSSVESGCSPVINVDYQRDHRAIRARSLGEVIEFWTHAVEAAPRSPSPRGPRIDTTMLPPEMHATGLL